MDRRSPRTRSQTAAARYVCNTCNRRSYRLTDEHTCPRCNQRFLSEEIIEEPVRDVLRVDDANAAQAATGLVQSNVHRTRSPIRDNSISTPRRNQRSDSRRTNESSSSNSGDNVFDPFLGYSENDYRRRRSILDYYLRSMRPAERPLNEEPPPEGLDLNYIQIIPTARISQEHVDLKHQCYICYDDFRINEEVKKLFCDHMFHEICITPWLRMRKTCPVCRTRLDTILNRLTVHIATDHVLFNLLHSHDELRTNLAHLNRNQENDNGVLQRLLFLVTLSEEQR